MLSKFLVAFFFLLSRCFLDFSVGVGAFCHETESDIFLFLLILINRVLEGRGLCRERVYYTTMP